MDKPASRQLKWFNPVAAATSLGWLLLVCLASSPLSVGGAPLQAVPDGEQASRRAAASGSGSPQAAERLQQEGLASFAAGDFAVAEQRFAAATTELPHDPTALFNRACALHALGQTEPAVELWRLAAASDDPRIVASSRYNLATTEVDAIRREVPEDVRQVPPPQRAALWSRLEQAAGQLRQALQVQPQHAAARQNLELLRLWMNQMRQQWEQDQPPDPPTPEDQQPKDQDNQPPDQQQQDQQQQDQQQQDQQQQDQQQEDQQQQDQQQQDQQQQDQQQQDQPDQQPQDQSPTPQDQPQGDRNSDSNQQAAGRPEDGGSERPESSPPQADPSSTAQPDDQTPGDPPPKTPQPQEAEQPGSSPPDQPSSEQNLANTQSDAEEGSENTNANEEGAGEQLMNGVMTPDQLEALLQRVRRREQSLQDFRRRLRALRLQEQRNWTERDW